ncbi:S53 family peptidase [Conexibacter stalactiti]|uniref:S53 family peptidase n=1 Tax=Conexibacter stalactiti TaxID=1940611 RepID=A0ABU4HNN2_9ACTN|nr:S53 family peptidase [Conexibacter stalactiti]MDW5594913.1 S53 family peptidase [Conexibacter stalactiti]MEC5035555.1 S53 family peptidase [Conexibacter stalactiti]
MRSRLPIAVAIAFLVLSGASAASAGGQEITFYLGLRRPEAAARAAVAAVADPAAASYRGFSTARAVAARYGASAATVAGLRRSARRHGLVVRVDRSRLFARLSGDVRRLERVFGVKIVHSYDNDTLSYGWSVAGGRALRLPRDMRPHVREVVASYTRSQRGAPGAEANGADAAEPAGARAPRGTTAAATTLAPANAGTWSGGCEAARRTGAYAFAQVRTAYGLDALGAAPGGGGAVAIVNVGEGVAAEDVAVGGRCFGLPELATRTLRSDGQARPFGRGSFEPQEDLALVRGMAPGLRAVTFAQAWLAPELWFLAPAAVLAAPSLPDTLSISYGQCERQIRARSAPLAARAGAELLDSVLVRLGLAGVGAFASAGDFGSSCNGQPYAGVTWPASSPFLTAVGGTRLVLDAGNARVDEVVWNDLAWLASVDGGGAGGGGFSAVSERPPYQRALTVAGARRAVPDVAAHASMLPGWPVNISTNWVQDAGTSASAPLLAGAFAALSARERAAGRPPLGPVNGLLYALAAQRPATLFDVVSGDNRYLAKVPGRRAAPGYDLASGLGVPRFDALATALPAPGQG